MIKKDQKIIPVPESLYAESMLYAILELILWHKYKQERKAEKGHSPIDQAP